MAEHERAHSRWYLHSHLSTLPRIGSSVGLGFDCGRLPSRATGEVQASDVDFVPSGPCDLKAGWQHRLPCLLTGKLMSHRRRIAEDEVRSAAKVHTFVGT